MLRSRFVAREFASAKRSDTYAPVTGCHTALIPLIYFKMLGDEPEGLGDDHAYSVTLASLDIKDAFRPVPQSKVIGVELQNPVLGLEKLAR